MEKKMTNAMAVGFVLDTYADTLPEDVKAKLVAIKTSYENKSANRKPTKTQEENVKTLALIKDVLATFDKPATISEIQAADETLGGLSNQKVSSLVRKLVETEEVVKTVEKKKSYFAIKTED